MYMYIYMYIYTCKKCVGFARKRWRDLVFEKKNTAKLRNIWPVCVFNPFEEYSSISIGTKILQSDTKWTWE